MPIGEIFVDLLDRDAVVIIPLSFSHFSRKKSQSHNMSALENITFSFPVFYSKGKIMKVFKKGEIKPCMSQTTSDTRMSIHEMELKFEFLISFADVEEHHFLVPAIQPLEVLVNMDFHFDDACMAGIFVGIYKALQFLKAKQFIHGNINRNASSI